MFEPNARTKSPYRLSILTMMVFSCSFRIRSSRMSAPMARRASSIGSCMVLPIWSLCRVFRNYQQIRLASIPNRPFSNRSQIQSMKRTRFNFTISTSALLLAFLSTVPTASAYTAEEQAQVESLNAQIAQLTADVAARDADLLSMAATIDSQRATIDSQGAALDRYRAARVGILLTQNARLRRKYLAALRPNVQRVVNWLGRFNDDQRFRIVENAYYTLESGCGDDEVWRYDTTFYTSAGYSSYTFSQSSCY